MNILIVGGTGSLGRKLTKHYVEKNWNVTVYSRDPHKQIALGREVPGARFILGDICNDDLMAQACMGQDVVINAAAIKHVHIGEQHPSEVVRVNVFGTETVAKHCVNNGVKKALLISSDKAVSAINLYGETKAIGEHLFVSRGFSALRYGNVVDSFGSVVRVWKNAIEEKKPIVIRKPVSTRFFLTVNDAIRLVDESIETFIGNAIFIPHSLRAFDIEALAKAMGVHNPIYENLLPGEKQHEILLSPHEQGRLHSNRLCSVWKGYRGSLRHDDFDSSKVRRMTVDEIIDEFPLI